MVFADEGPNVACRARTDRDDPRGGSALENPIEELSAPGDLGRDISCHQRHSLVNRENILPGSIAPGEADPAPARGRGMT